MGSAYEVFGITKRATFEKLFRAGLVTVVLVAFFGCKKPAPISEMDAPATTTTEGPETTDVAILEGRYRTYSETSERFDTINALAGAEPAKAIAALGRLLSSEKDPELRATMVDTVATFDDEVPAKLAIIAPLVGNPAEPEEVRDAAFAALELIDDRAAIPAWQKLLKNGDEDIREVARMRIEELKESIPAE